MTVRGPTVQAWLRQHGDQLAAGVSLAISIGIAPLIFGGGFLPWSGMVLAACAFALVLPTRAPESVTFGARLATASRTFVAIAVVEFGWGWLIGHWAWKTYGFLPIWVGLTVIIAVADEWGLDLRSKLRFSVSLQEARARATRLLQPAVAAYIDVAASGSFAIWVVVVFASRLEPALGLNPYTAAIPAILWLAIDLAPIARWQSAPNAAGRLVRFAVRIATWALLCATAATATGIQARQAAAWILVSGLVLAGFCALHLGKVVAGAENARRLVIAAAVAWLAFPFATPAIIGSGDSVWYSNVLGDFTRQVQAGVFPVFVSQSEALFNGAVFPIRFAPLFQHMGLVLDFVTFRTLGSAALQNAVLVTTLAIAGIAAYSVLCLLAESRRWVATALTLLYLGCPGVLALIYTSDLMMTWTALPWLPLAFGGCWLAWCDRGARPIWMMAIGLGLLWWAHSPVALWTTTAVAAVQAIRMALRPPTSMELRGYLAAGVVFALLAGYPVISVLAVPLEPGATSAAYSMTAAYKIVHFIRESFPGILIPLTFKSRSLSDFQPGLPLLIVYGCCVAAAARSGSPAPRRLDFWAALSVPFVIAVLLIPLPSDYGALLVWEAVPAFLRNPTGNWPVQRLLPIAAAASVCACAALLSRRGDRPGGLSRLLLLAAVAWTFADTLPLVRLVREFRVRAEHTAAPNIPENNVLTRYAYLVFAKLPAYYSHGFMDPVLENRLLAKDTMAVVASNADAAISSPGAGRLLRSGAFSGAQGTAGAPWRLEPEFRLEPGKRYALQFEFSRAEFEGTLIASGGPLKRVTGFPEYGERAAFGPRPGNSRVMSYFTSGATAVDFHLDFIAGGADANRDFSAFGRYRWFEINPEGLPVRVTNWIPYEATVTTSVEAWLETPRMYQTGYRATVNGGAVATAKSPEGLVMLPVPAGESRIQLSYHPPLMLTLAYLASLGTIVGCALGAGAGWLRRSVSTDRPGQHRALG